MKLGKAFKMARTRAGIKQGDLAKTLGVSSTYISMLENDHRDPSWSFVCSACEALQIPIPMLLLLAADANDALSPSPARTIIQKELMEHLMAATTPDGDST